MSSRLPRSVREGLSDFIQAARKTYGDPVVYLFGSYATGDYLEDSDIDLVVVSEKFRGLSMPERVRRLRRLAPRSLCFEILAYTSEELKKARRRSYVIQDAASYWRLIS